MPIKPLVVLPQLKPVTYQDPAQNNQSFRILEEIIQQENANERARQSGLLAAKNEYGDLLKDAYRLGESPMAQKVFGEYKQRLSSLSGQLKNTYDPQEYMDIVRQADVEYRTDPRVERAVSEDMRGKQLIEVAKANADSIDPEYFGKFINRFYDPARAERGEFMKPEEFNFGRLFMTPEKFLTNFIDSVKYSDDKVVPDDAGNKVWIESRTIIPTEDEFKNRLLDRMSSNPIIFGDMSDEAKAGYINRAWQDANTKYSGKKISSLQTQVEEGEKTTKEKETSSYKAFTPGEEGAKLGGLQEVRREKDGTFNVFDKEGQLVASGPLEVVWNSFTDQVKNDAKRFGLTPNFDLPNIERNKADIVRNGKAVGAGLSADDAKIVGASKTTFTPDGWMHTNDPEALSNAGYRSGYDTKKKQYYITKKDGDGTDKVYEGSPTFRTLGGGSVERRFVVKVDDGFKRAKKAGSQVGNNTPVPVESDDLPELRMIAPEESGTEGDLAINASDMGAPSIGKTQINGADVQKEWLGSVGLGDKWGDVLKEDTTARQSLEKEYKPKLDAIKSVGGEKEEELKAEYNAKKKAINDKINKTYKDMVGGLSAEERKKLAAARNEIMEEKFWEPSRAAFQEVFGVEVPDKVRGLLAAMAGQHYKGVVTNKTLLKDINKAAGAGKIKQLIEQGKEDEVIDIISDVRKEYLKGLDLPNKASLLKRVDRDRERAKAEKAQGQQPKSATAPTPPPSPAQADSVRADGTKKGKGYLGELKMKDGSNMTATELTIGVSDPDGKEIEIPTLVPTLTKEEIDWLLTNGVDIAYSKTKIAERIRQKAVNHAQDRMSKGLPIFAGDEPIKPPTSTDSSSNPLKAKKLNLNIQ